MQELAEVLKYGFSGNNRMSAFRLVSQDYFLNTNYRMSASALLNSATGQFLPQYLPVGPAPAHPYLENPFQDPVDGNNEPLTNLASLNIGQQGAIPIGLGLQVGGGANALFTGKLGVDVNKFIETVGTSLNIENQDAGQINLVVDASVVISPNNPTGTGSLQIFNGTTSAGGQTHYEVYVPGTSGGGLTVGDLAIYGYNGTNINPVFQSNSLGDNIILGSTIPLGSVVSVNGLAGASRVFDTVYNKPFESGQATLNAGVVTVNIPGALLTSVIVATCIGQINSQSSTVAVESVGTPNPGDVVFRATDASDNRTFNFIAVV